MLRKYLVPVLLIAAFVLSACAQPAAAPAAVEAEAPAATKAPAATEAPAVVVSLESPMLAEKVKAGTLPPLEERLPDEPMVVGPGVYQTVENLPDWAPGKFGGTMRSAHSVANWNPDIFVMMNEPFLMAPKIGDQNIVCAICQSYKVSDDNKVFEFTLRKGMKWSDGVPVTTEDVLFAWQDVRNTEKISPSGPPNQWRTGFSAEGNPAKMDIIDDYTFKVTFDGPYGAFLRALTIEGWVGYTQVLEPAHYLKKYHINHTTLEELKPELEALNLKDEWWQVFSAKRCQNWDMTNPRCVGYPALNPWIGKATTNPSAMNFERNPYYFKVDTTGQQLPYFDFLTSQQVNDTEMVALKIVAGEVDFQRESTGLVKMPLYKEAEEKGGYRIQLLDMHVDSSGLRLNQTFQDKNWREVSQDIRFRQAVSLSINRQELIDTIYYGYAGMPLTTMGKENSQYDVEKANGLLDAMGLDKKDADGFRKYKDGKVLDILIEHGAHAPDIAPVADLTSQYLKAIGLKTTIKTIDPQLWGEKWSANEIQATIMWSHDIGWGNDVSSGSVDRAGRLWNVFQATKGKEGEEGPAWTKEAFDRDAKKWAAVPGSAEYNKQVADADTWSQTNLPYINFVEYVQYPLIVNKNMKNVPVDGYAIGGNFSVVQMYYDTP